jgi:hypothetical protein
MAMLKERCRQAFKRSRKLARSAPTQAQLENVAMRLKQIFTDEELDRMEDDKLMRQVERVWPIARFVDQPR